MKSFEKSFDGDLEMFREENPIDFARLDFLRWLAEHGKLEHPTAGPPSGPFAGEPAATIDLASAA